MERFVDSKGSLTIRNGHETVLIECYGRGLRVRSVVKGEVVDQGYGLLSLPIEEGSIHIGEKVATIEHAGIKAVVDQHDWRGRSRISFYDSEGKLLLREIDSMGALDLHARHFKGQVGGNHALTVTFEADEDEKFFGMGQYQQEVMDLKHCVLELAQRNSQASVPFVLSCKGYGFLWHNPSVGEVQFARNKTVWKAASTKQMDYWITAGETPAAIVEAYSEVTGKVPMMPEYGLGFWQCKLRYYNQEQILEVARGYKERNIPIDVIVCDFFHWPYMGDFRFDEAFFPDPKAMVSELKSMGIELMVSVWPQVDRRSENYQEMLENGLLVGTESGVDIQMVFGGYSSFYDATNPEARKYVWEKCKKNYYDMGIKIFWLDEAEPEYAGYDFANYRYHIGPVAEQGNAYPQMFSRGFYEGMDEEGQENIVNLVRCAWVGSQRYGALVWSGDIHSSFEDYRKQVCAGLHMGIAGIPWWTTDIGGFAGGDPKDEAFIELLIRWFQYGTFCPVMRLHGDRLPATKLYHPTDGRELVPTGSDNEIWSYGEEAYDILSRLIRFRETMRPYTRSLMNEAHEKGSPLIRTMFYEFPDDPICWELKDQYMYGDELLVAPILYANARTRRVYLPEGEWLMLNDGKTYESGWHEIDCPIETIPVFNKGGNRSEWVGLL